MKVSVILSTYNPTKEKLEILERLCMPGFLNNKASELIILDDCSPLKKETSEIVKKNLKALKKNYKRVIF